MDEIFVNAMSGSDTLAQDLLFMERKINDNLLFLQARMNLAMNTSQPDLLRTNLLIAEQHLSDFSHKLELLAHINNKENVLPSEQLKLCHNHVQLMMDGIIQHLREGDGSAERLQAMSNQVDMLRNYAFLLTRNFNA